jgi:hypothetical protein
MGVLKIHWFQHNCSSKWENLGMAQSKKNKHQDDCCMHMPTHVKRISSDHLIASG